MVGTIACQDISSCGGHPRRLEFENIGQADRIDVIGTGNEMVASITDRTRIQAAVIFIDRYHDGWIEAWTGPRAGALNLQFYEGSRETASFGISERYIAAGGLFQKVPESEITALAAQLGLRWPPER